jgi:hypothetical protein
MLADHLFSEAADELTFGSKASGSCKSVRRRVTGKTLDDDIRGDSFQQMNDLHHMPAIRSSGYLTMEVFPIHACPGRDMQVMDFHCIRMDRKNQIRSLLEFPIPFPGKSEQQMN